MQKENNLLWLDLEMTGLDVKRDRILEISVLITDQNLQLVATGPSLVVHQSSETLAQMDNWNCTAHSSSGLLAAVQDSDLTETGAEDLILDFAGQYCVTRQSPLCGNSIWQDRHFLVKYMPKLHEFLHYRVIDVSTVKQLVQYWYPAAATEFSKKKAHRGHPDILESVAELKFYRSHFFV